MPRCPGRSSSFPGAQVGERFRGVEVARDGFEIPDVAAACGGGDLPGRDHVRPRVVGDRDEPGDRPSVLGDFDGISARSHLGQVAASVLSKLTDTDPFHVLHDSTIWVGNAFRNFTARRRRVDRGVRVAAWPSSWTVTRCAATWSSTSRLALLPAFGPKPALIGWYRER